MALQQQVLVVEDFEAHYEDELSLNVGEYLTVTQQNIEDGWWEGKNHTGQTGRFPLMFVQVVNQESQEVMNLFPGSQNVDGKQVRVVVEFDGGDDDELRLVAGELLTVLHRDEEEGWLRGCNQTGQYGRFPAFFVEELHGNQQITNSNVEESQVAVPKTSESHGNQQITNSNVEEAQATVPDTTESAEDNMIAQANYVSSENNAIPHVENIPNITNVLDNIQEFVNNCVADVWKPEYSDIIDEQANQLLLGAVGGGEEDNSPNRGGQEDTSHDTSSNPMKVIVTEDFISTEGGELSIYKGESLIVTRTDIDWEDAWWEGVNLTGEMGRFPRIFVREEEEKPLIEKKDYELCENIHSCGHTCCGIKGEPDCLPCLYGCAKNDKLNQTSEDLCVICFTEPLKDKPSIQVACGHVFHAECCREMLLQSYPGPRITFNFICCPICKAQVSHWSLSEQLEPNLQLYKQVEEQALQRLEYDQLRFRDESIAQEGNQLQEDQPDLTPNTVEDDKQLQIVPPDLISNEPDNVGVIVNESMNDRVTTAMNHYAFYMCYKCKKPYFGGDVRCEDEANQIDSFDPRELVCGRCSDVSKNKMCPKHGTEFLIFKCQFCCSVAVYFCRGTHHVCNACHEDFHHVEELQQANRLPKCPAGPRGAQLTDVSCPLQMTHPETGVEYCIGCALCSSTYTFNKKKTESLPPKEPPMPYY